MRRFGIALCLLLAAAGPPAVPGTWTVQTSGTTANLTGVAFLNATEGFAVGAGGVIRRTLDGGATAWTGQTTSSTANLNGVGLGSADLGCAAGDLGTIVQTLNGSAGAGSTWAPVTTGDLAAVGASDATHAWTVGVPGALRLSSNGGTDWPLGNPGSSTVQARGMSFLTAPTEGYWVGDMGTVMKTSDGTTWTSTGSVATGQNLNSICMVAASAPGTAVGWLVGNAGVLRKTINSGGTWTNPSSGTTQNLNGVFAGDNTHGWAVGNNGTLIATTNGNTWAAQSNPVPGAVYHAVSFFNSGGMWKGVAVGATGTALWSDNGGMTWTTGASGAGTLRGAAMLSDTVAVAVGDAGTILKSIDGGASYSPVGAGLTTDNLLAVSFGSAGNGWAVGANGTILATTDGGGTWIVQVAGAAGSLRDVKFASPTVVVAVGESGAILKSSNGGAQFVRKAVGTASTLNSVAFGSPTRGVAVGAGGVLLGTDNAGDTWTAIVPTTALTADLLAVSALSATLFVGVGGSVGGASVAVAFDTTSSTWSAAVSSTPPAQTLRGLSFAPYSRQGYGVADLGSVWVTKDAGSTWVSEVSAAPGNLRGASFPFAGLGWAVGDGGAIVRRTSPVPPLLSFPPHVGTPHTYVPPLIDGFVDPELSDRRRPDTGWDCALELTYSDGTSQPPFQFRGLRHNGGNYVYLSFVMTGDTGFDNDDTVVILFRGDNPTPRPEHAANDRRIIINPLTTGTGSPAGAIVAPGSTPLPTYTNNENGAPRTLTSYRWNTGTNGWTALPPSAEIDCKVRSWIPTPGNYCWSVELKIPTVNTTYTDWIDIGTDFLLSFYALRVQTGGVVEASWPRDLAISGPKDVVDAPLSAFDWGTAKLGSADDGVGVRVKVPYWSNLGVTVPSTGSTLKTEINGSQVNTFHVWVQNNSDTAATAVQPTFRIADWGVQGGNGTDGAFHVVRSDLGTPNPPAAATIPALSGTVPGELEYTFNWTLNSTENSAYAPPHEHQCVQVNLDSSGNVNLTERSVWLNMNWVPASVFGRQATVSSVGYGFDGARKGAQRFYLHTTSERFDFTPGKIPLDVVAKPGKQDGQADRKTDHPYYTGDNLQRVRLLGYYPGLTSEKTSVSHYTWVIHGVKETSRTVKINGHVYPVLEQANGFGYVARHGSAVDQWTSGLTGAIVKKLNDFEYEVTVPAEGSAVLDTGLEAKDGGVTGTGGGLFGLILLILIFLLVIFWILKKKR